MSKLALPGCSVSPPLSSARTAAIMDAEPWGGLAVSLDGDEAYAARVEGTLPKGLRGTLYRNGPGLFDRRGGAEPPFVETEASFMWHSFNGHEEGDDLVLDFDGYDDPDHSIGKAPLALEVMQGRPGRFEHPGSVRCSRVAPGAARARSEVLAPGNFEWPRIDDRLLGRRQRWGYVQSAREKRFFWNAVARVDFEGGNVERLDFGDRVFTSEPVFVPAAGW